MCTEQLLGRIFFGRNMSNEDVANTSENDEASESHNDGWTLEDYHAILELNEDIQDRPTVIDETKTKIQKDLHINLFDLLNWFRNPDTSLPPQRFNTVKDLANYSYSHNKVFPRYQAPQSRIANPLLREIGLYHHTKNVAPRQGRRGIGKPRGELWRKYSATLVDEAVKTTPVNEAFEDKIGAGQNDVPAEELSQANGPQRKNGACGRRRAIELGDPQATSIAEMPIIATAA